MKLRLNLTVDKRLLDKAKVFAARNNTSLTQLVENYFESLLPTTRKNDIIRMVEELPKAKIDLTKDLKQCYYEERQSFVSSSETSTF